MTDPHAAQVLENRTGIPITMALVYSNIASRLGLPMIGINLPG
jgi:regulator of sirC expression with transglutaminase-like and TPR domain